MVEHSLDADAPRGKLAREIEDLLELAENISADIERYRSAAQMSLISTLVIVIITISVMFSTPIIEHSNRFVVYNGDIEFGPYAAAFLLLISTGISGIVWSLLRLVRWRKQLRVDSANLNEVISIAAQILSKARIGTDSLEYAVYRMRIRRLNFSGTSLFGLPSERAYENARELRELLYQYDEDHSSF